MSDDEYLDFIQYPDLFGSLDDLEDELFVVSEAMDENGFIVCPFLPLRETVLYPQMVMPLFVGRERSLSAVQAAVNNNEPLIVAAQRDSDVLEPESEDIYRVGTEVAIGRILRLPDNSTSVLAQGRRRVEIVEFVQWDPYIRVRARHIPDQGEWERSTEALMRAVLALFDKVVDLNYRLPEEAYTFALNIDEPGWLADFIASTLDISLHERQEIIETFDVNLRLQRLSAILAQELDVLELENQIHSRVQQEIDRSQREHFLREQMRAIQGELGESDIFTQELEEVRTFMEKKLLPTHVRERANKEMARLASMPPMSPEVGIIRTYLDWLLELPWLESSDDSLDVRHAADVLDANHYGLDRVKDRILEYIAVKKIATSAMRSPILCFVGPPGTGKTSLGRSIASSLNREFVRISLGGIRDEAEIRGHRRTYIGALPGRIIQAIRRAGKNNPLFMLDEVDKLGQDFRGDPAAALLEVLDPEQNKAFVDHYIELEFDLSKVLFITTANSLHTIPPALQDRMEVIEFSGYLDEEKLEISRQFLIPRQLSQHGLDEAGIRFEDTAVQRIIRSYTYESGVRNLEREIGSICRKVARRVAEERRYRKRITAEIVEEMLGAPRFSQDLMREEDEIGVVSGLAWTPAGGDTLDIEVTLMPGRGEMILTGQMGDVMRESARAALSYTRSQAERLELDGQAFTTQDIHLHIPEGAVPKDGPSAGIALTLALISAFTRRPVRRDVGLTGEITLRGRVLPVGGIREKALAARRAGLKTIILPKKNRADLDNVPKKLRQELEVVLVEHMNQVLDVALLPVVTPPPRGRGRKPLQQVPAPKKSSPGAVPPA